MRPQRDAKRLQWLLTVLTVCVIALSLLIVGRSPVRIDLSPGRVFSLSDVSLDLVEDISDPVDIRYYVSDYLRTVSGEPDNIYEILRQYGAASGGRIVSRRISADNGGVEGARDAGLRSEQLRESDGDGGYTVRTVYSGLIVRYLDREVSIPFVSSVGQVEYEVSLALWSLFRRRRPEVAVMLGSDGESIDEDYSSLREELSQRFSLTEVHPGEAIPATAAVVMVLGSRSFSERHLRPLIEALERGSSAFLAVDGVRLDISGLRAQPLDGDRMNELLEPFGLGVEPFVIMDRRANEFPPEFTGGSIVQYPPWVSTDQRNFDPDHPVGTGSAGIDLFWPSPVRIGTPSTGRTGPLVVTTPEAWLQSPPFVLDPENRPALRRDQAETTGSYALSAWSEGVFDPGSRLVVVGDSDFISNLVFYTDSFANYLFVERSLLWLFGEDGLSALSPAPTTTAALDRIEDPFARVMTGRIVEGFNVIVLPVVVLLVGLIRLRVRTHRDVYDASGVTDRDVTTNRTQKQ